MTFLFCDTLILLLFQKELLIVGFTKVSSLFNSYSNLSWY